MSYIEPNFHTTIQELTVGEPTSGAALGTVTASATQTYTGTLGSLANGTYRFPVFKNPASILGVRVYCTGAAGAGVTGINLSFLNGTQVIGSCAAPAIGTFVDATLGNVTLDSHGVVVASSTPVYFTGTNGEITMLNTATGTASGSSLGTYAVDVLWRNLFVS